MFIAASETARGRRKGFDMPYRKAMLTALVLGAALAMLAAPASARRLEFSNQTFRAVFPGGESIENFNVNCPVTLEGSFHSRTMAKVSGALVGYVTRGVVGSASCSGGRMRFLTERLPWHIRFQSFAGTLPNITRMTFQIVGWGILFEYTIAPGSTCLYLTTAAMPTRFILSREAGGAIEPFTLDEASAINLFTGEPFICPASKVLGGQFTYRVLGSTSTKIVVRLVQ
jgi:hypothetical protein